MIENEAQLLDKFGQPKQTDEQYEYWMSCAEYLSYGGIMQVVRVDGEVLNNSNAGVNTESTTVKIKNKDNFDLFWDSGLLISTGHPETLEPGQTDLRFV